MLRSINAICMKWHRQGWWMYGEKQIYWETQSLSTNVQFRGRLRTARRRRIMKKFNCTKAFIMFLCSLVLWYLTCHKYDGSEIYVCTQIEMMLVSSPISCCVSGLIVHSNEYWGSLKITSQFIINMILFDPNLKTEWNHFKFWKEAFKA